MLRSRRQRGKKRRALRLYFATDIHGSDVCFRKFLAAAKVYQADAVILGGDFAGKALVPVLARGRGPDRADRGPERDRAGGGVGPDGRRHQPGRVLPGADGGR